MQENTFLYQAIHQYLQSGIKTGVFPKDAFLPTIQELCDALCVGPTTIRLALQMLEKEGFLRICKGRPAQVVWTMDWQELAVQYRSYFAKRASVQEDFSRNLPLIFAPLCFQGLLAAGAHELDGLEKTARRLDANHLFAAQQFFLRIFAPLGNQLVLQLVLDIAVFRQFAGSSLLLNAADDSFFHSLRDALLSLVVCTRQKDWDTLRTRLFALLSFPAAGCYPVIGKVSIEPTAEQVPFEWQTYKGRKQYCFRIAQDVIRKMRENVYPPFMPLPAPPTLAEEYGVSVRAVRQALKLLNNLGLVETVNGVGSQTRSLYDKAVHCNWQDSAVQKNILVFLQALQIVTITCGQIICQSFPFLSKDDCDRLAQLLTEDLKNTVPNGIFEHRHILFKENFSPIISEVYRQLYQLTIWGHAALFHTGYRELLPQWQCLTRRMLAALTRRDAASLAAATQQLFGSYYVHCRDQAVIAGITEANNIAVPVLVVPQG